MKMHHNSRFLSLWLSLLFLPLVFSDARKDAAGGWTPIENIDNPHVTEIAKFAVDEYNKESKTNLELVKVIKGEIQVVEGVNYRLDLNATDGAAVRAYQAVVWEKAWEDFRNLTSFIPLLQA